MNAFRQHREEEEKSGETENGSWIKWPVSVQGLTYVRIVD